ncbi:MAG: glutamate racemase [Firmicutes bacterium]|nr:glutamate racemase [Bacillota bacterium]
MDKRPIGIFDSGLGGLTCIAPIAKALPGERILYFGDTARTPYGSKSRETVCEFALQIADFLVKNDVKMLAIACNTISATAIPLLQESYPEIPVVGIIEPAAAEVAASCSAGNSIGIIATKVTVKTKAYERAIKKHDPSLSVYQMACPAFVPLIEENIIESDIMDSLIRYYLDDFISYHRIDTLVLGCTHYPLIKENILRLYPKLRIINPSDALASAVERSLRENELLSDDTPKESTFFASDISENFIQMVDRIITETDYNIAIRKF